MRRLFLGLALILGVAAATPPASAQPLVADLSSHLIAITTGFAGTEVMLYGAADGMGDIVVVVRGPETSTTVRRKVRLGGIWINRDSMTFAGVPSFYRIAATRPLAEIASPSVRSRHQLGVDQLRLNPEHAEPGAEIASFRDGLVRNKERAKLFVAAVGGVTMLRTDQARLFRTNIELPANVPTGTFTAEVFYLRNGQVVAAQSTPMVVSKIGFGAELYDFAHRYAAFYGIIAIAIAVLAGWGASVAFRRS